MVEWDSRGARGRARLSRYNLGSIRYARRVFPLHLLHFAGRFFRLLSVYVVYHYLSLPSSSLVVFTFLCTSMAAVLFLLVHRPWKGRPLTTHQLVPTVINGALMALSYVMWGQGLRACGPLRTIMAEYVGGVLGAASTLVLGRGGGKRKKVAGLVAMVASYFFLSQGWAMAGYSPFSYGRRGSADDSSLDRGHIGLHSMSLAILAGVLAGLVRVIARRVSLKTQMKRRLHVISITAAVCFLFPIAMFEATQTKVQDDLEKLSLPIQTILLYSLFGIVVAFYMDLVAEERLRISVMSPKHLVVTSGCISALELIYGMDFSLLGFLICASLLGLGILESSPVERVQREGGQLPMQVVNDMDESQKSLIMSPFYGPGPESR